MSSILRFTNLLAIFPQFNPQIVSAQHRYFLHQTLDNIVSILILGQINQTK